MVEQMQTVEVGPPRKIPEKVLRCLRNMRAPFLVPEGSQNHHFFCYVSIWFQNEACQGKMIAGCKKGWKCIKNVRRCIKNTRSSVCKKTLVTTKRIIRERHWCII